MTDTSSRSTSLKRGLPQQLGVSSERIAPLASATGTISLTSNLLKVRGNKRTILRNRQREREKKDERSERRSSVLKSLAVLDIGDDDEIDIDMDTFCFSSKPKAGRTRNLPQGLEDDLSDCEARKGRYLRRGSVTKHKLDAEVSGIQPNSRCVGGEGDESDYGSDYDGDAIRDADRKKRYLRRGSVTKYVLDAKVNGIQPNSRCVGGEGDESDYGSDYDGDSLNDSDQKRRYLRRGSVTKYVLDAKVNGMQPTRVLEDSRNRPRPPLPPPPKNTIERHAVDSPASLPPLPRGASRPPLRPPSSQSNNLDDSGHGRSILIQDKKTRNVSKPNRNDRESQGSPKTNLDDSGHVPISRRISSSSIDEDTASSENEKEFPTPVATALPVKKKKSAAVRQKSGKTRSARGNQHAAATKKKNRSSKKPDLRSGVAQVQSSSPSLQGCLKREETKRRALAKKVRFGELVITEFPIILGDNPAVTSGAPVTIDWTSQGEVSYKINVYESVRGTRRRRRKLLITVSNRAILLLAAGYSIDEIADASINAQQIKYGRQESMQNQSWDRLNMMMETTNSTLGTLMENTGKKIKAIVKPMQHSEIARTA